MKILIIRPQPGADATAARVQAAGHEPLVMPLFKVEPVEWAAPDAVGYDGLLLTSANAVRQAGPQLTRLADLPVLAVGQVTAKAALAAGLRVDYIGDAGAQSLLQETRNRRLLWLAGEDHIELSASSSAKIDIRVVYRSAVNPVPVDFPSVILHVDYLLLHSARAAIHVTAALVDQGIEKGAISIAVLSQAIADAAGGGWKTVRVAPSPDDAALLSCL